MDYKTFKTVFETIEDNYPELEEMYNEVNGESLASLCPDLFDEFGSTNNEHQCSKKIIRYINNSICSSIDPDSDISAVLESTYPDDTARGSKTALQCYFDEIGKLYEDSEREQINPAELEFCPANRDKIIELNLKSVIDIAKKFRGMGLQFEDLIGAGNEGLVVAFNKYDPSRAKLQNTIIDIIEENKNKTSYSRKEIMDLFGQYLKYGKVKDRLLIDFKQDRRYTKEELVKWTKRNIHNAKFNSVANLWIRAYILIELTNNSRLIKKPKAEIKKEKTGESKKEIYIDINKPVGDMGGGNSNSTSTFGDVLDLQEDKISEMELDEVNHRFRDSIAVLLTGVKVRNRRIIMMRYGLGLPRPMTPQEIADHEHISVARTSQIVQQTTQAMKDNAVKYSDLIDKETMYELASQMTGNVGDDDD